MRKKIILLISTCYFSDCGFVSFRSIMSRSHMKMKVPSSENIYLPSTKDSTHYTVHINIKIKDSTHYTVHINIQIKDSYPRYRSKKMHTDRKVHCTVYIDIQFYSFRWIYPFPSGFSKVFLSDLHVLIPFVLSPNCVLCFSFSELTQFLFTKIE